MILQKKKKNKEQHQHVTESTEKLVTYFGSYKFCRKRLIPQ